MQDFSFLHLDCPFLEVLEGNPPIMTSVYTNPTIISALGSGYTHPLSPLPPFTIQTFLVLPLAISSGHKGDNDKN